MFGQPKQNKAIDENIGKSTGALSDAGSFLMGEGKKALPAGFEAIMGPGGPLEFWKNILGGDEHAIDQFLQPESNTISNQYDAAFKAVNENAPRGGGRNAAYGDLAFEKAGKLSELFATARPRAAAEVTNIGQLLASLGLSSETAGSQDFQAINQADLARRDQNIRQQQSSLQFWSQLGNSLGTAAGGTNFATL